MNDTILIKRTLNKLENKNIHFKDIEYGNDSVGTPAVWIHFDVDRKKIAQKELIMNINKFSRDLKDNLLKNGLQSWPYINFHESV